MHRRERENTEFINNKTKLLCTVIFSVMQYMNAPHIVQHPHTLQTSPVTLSTLIIYTMCIQRIKRFFLSDLMTSDSISPFSLICWMSELQSKLTITT